MTFDSLISVVALLLAVYAIVPRPRQLAFWLRVTPLEWAIVIAALLAIHVLLLFSSSAAVESVSRAVRLAPGHLAYLVLVVAIVAIVLHRCRARLPKSNLPRLHDSVQELLALEDFNAVVPLLRDHLDELVEIADEEDRDGSATHPASHLLQAAFTHTGLIHAVARNYPDFGLRVARLDKHEHEFTDEFLRAMLADEHSLLASEIRLNQNVESDRGYRLDSRNRLLQGLLADASFAEQRAMYRPIGEAMLDELNTVVRDDSGDPYLRDADRSFRERSQFRLPLFVGLRFLEIMIWCALRQGVQWHMWLYYFPHFTEAACRNCDRHPDNYFDTGEWPNRYCYFIYDMIHTLAAWATSVNHDSIAAAVPPLIESSADHQNSSIPKSSIIAMASCLDIVARSPTIPAGFKNELMRTALEVFFTLRITRNGERYATVVLNVLVQRRSPEYVALLKHVATNMDTLHYLDAHVDELQQRVAALRA